jgi:hypothetical protein
LDLGRILDDDEAVSGRGLDYVVDDAVRERRLAGAGPADDQDVAASATAVSIASRCRAVMILCRSYSCSGNTAEALRRIVNTGADTTGGIRASNREPSSGSSHSRIGFSRVTVLRNVLATVAMKDSAVAGGIVPAGIQHQLDDIRFVQQPAESAELALHAFRKPARLFSRVEVFPESPILGP